MPLKMRHVIANLRDEKKLNIRELADILNIGHSTVSSWERGQSYPQMATFIKLLNLFNVSADTLLDGERDSLDYKRIQDTDQKNLYSINKFVEIYESLSPRNRALLEAYGYKLLEEQDGQKGEQPTKGKTNHVG